jgi:hypothetical protein
MKRPTLAILATFVLTPVSLLAQSPEQEVVATVQRLFDAMRDRDTAAIRGTMAPGSQLVALRTRGDSVVAGTTTVDAFVTNFASGTEELLERMWDPEIRIDGPMATVWAPYDFHRGETFSHCGIDAFQLAQTKDGWKIVSIIYTVRRTGCE